MGVSIYWCKACEVPFLFDIFALGVTVCLPSGEVTVHECSVLVFVYEFLAALQEIGICYFAIVLLVLA